MSLGFVPVADDRQQIVDIDQSVGHMVSRASRFANQISKYRGEESCALFAQWMYAHRVEEHPGNGWVHEIRFQSSEIEVGEATIPEPVHAFQSSVEEHRIGRGIDGSGGDVVSLLREGEGGVLLRKHVAVCLGSVSDSVREVVHVRDDQKVADIMKPDALADFIHRVHHLLVDGEGLPPVRVAPVRCTR